MREDFAQRKVVTFSLPCIIQTGSKGMISARIVKAPPLKKRKKNNPGSGSNSFRGQRYDKQLIIDN